MTEFTNIAIMLGGVWQTADVSDQPEIILSHWRVMEIVSGTRRGQRHLVGYNQADREGRVSTAIMKFDEESGQCLTESGRVYWLVGPPGYDSDGDYVWQSWLAANAIPAVRDVSSEYGKTSL